MKTAIVIPAFNEALLLRKTLTNVRASGFDWIIVVDDGSTDDTARIGAEMATVVRHPINRGMGAALVSGTQHALRNGADCIVHFDADGQHTASEIERLVAPIRNGKADIVLGSRYLQPNKLPFTKKYLIHRPALLFQNLLTGLKLTDVHNGFRAMNRTAAEQIIITQDRMAHASEIVSEVARNRLRYLEVPVTISYHEYGQGFAAGVRIMKDLLVKKILK